MSNFYQLDALLSLLKYFKVNKIIMSGWDDSGDLINKISEYDADIYLIGENNGDWNNINVINDYPLKSLKTLKEYDAIFINDDANWFTVYNELQIIKNNNEEFPLTFVCNNKFPNKLRDSYRNPNIIPKEFLHENIKKYPLEYNSKKIYIEDNYYHAINDDSPKNGVCRAINDFLNENIGLDLLDINFTEDITVIYPKSNINKIRLDKFKDEIKDKSVDLDLSKEIIEYRLLFEYINEHSDGFNNNIPLQSEIMESNNLNDSKNKIQLQNDQINLKNSKIINLESELDLKESEINNIQSKLHNKSNEINNIYYQMNSLQNEFKDYKNKLNSKNSTISTIRKNLRTLKKENYSLKNEYNSIKNEYNSIKNELNRNKNELSYLKKDNFHQLTKLESNEYSINSFKETIVNNDVEIQYLENNRGTRLILSPLSYLILIFKSKPSELFLNIKLYKNLKTSKCFNVGYYLNNNQDIMGSKWYKFFSPELHYVCNGFDENREINKKYFNWKSKKELLSYLLNSK